MSQKQFKDFLHDIEPSATTKAAASNAHTAARDHLANDDDFRAVHQGTYLSGSYRRDTAIRPAKVDGVARRPDVDIIVVTSHSLDDSPAAVLKLLRGALKKKYSETRKQSRSIGVFTSAVDMDVVPIIEPGNGKLYIPDRKLEDWLETNPPRHTEWTTEVNKSADGRFKPLVKLMKWWRRENKTVSKYPKGFVIECVVAECMDRSETPWGELLARTLETIGSKYDIWLDSDIVPHIDDPGVPGNSVTSNISLAAFEGFCKKAKAHGEIAAEAVEEDDAEKAAALWRKVLGERFPSPPSSAGKLLKGATAVEGLTFPDKPVRPNKPGGFA